MTDTDALRRNRVAINKATGLLIAQYRARREWSMRKVAEKVGVHLNTVYRWEIGETRVAVADLVLLADAFGIEPIRLVPVSWQK